MTAVLVKHDPGCKWSRAQDVVLGDEGQVVSAKIGPGHDDAAKRFADWYNLHKLAGQGSGVIAVALADGSSDGEVYPSRETAIAHMHHNERRFFYIRLQAPSMSVCQAASLLYFHRVMAGMQGTDRDLRAGGPEVIPSITREGFARQIRAVQDGRGMLALGYGREARQG